MKIQQTLSCLAILCATHTAAHPRAAGNDPPREIGAMMGGGNFTNGATDAVTVQQFKALQAVGAKMCRINLYPGHYVRRRDWNTPNARSIDGVMKLAYQYGVTPIVLFEYYTDYYQNEGFGNYQQWFGIGQAFAARYRPNGSWGQENGIKDWGITIYTAMNEPEPGEFRKGGKLGPEPYVAALKGLADGVHAVDKTLKVLPGGFMAANAWNDWTLRGLGPALAPLFNDGTLDGIDLHTYYDIKYAPMENQYGDSAQSNFDDVKKAGGITADINFYSTEFNYKKREVTEEQAARGFLTGIWDNLGVVKNDGASGATGFAFPWNLFNEATKDTEYGMRVQLDPYVPSPRGDVLKLVLGLTKGMTFAARDPRKTGEYVLTGNGKKLWVWQNRKGWTNHPGNSYTVTDIPVGTRRLEVYGWNGLRQVVPAHETSLTIQNLGPEETHMILANYVAAGPDIPLDTRR